MRWFTFLATMLAVSAPAEASRYRPFESGYYVPAELASSCNEANFKAYDWVLRFDRTNTGSMGSSEGTCNLMGWSAKGKNTYAVELQCVSQDETTSTPMTIRLEREHGRITEIDGTKYAWCAPLEAPK